MKQLLSKSAVWAIIVSHFCANWGTYVLLAWLPTYFNKGLGVDFSEVGVYTMIPYLFAFLSLNMGGWIADKLIHRGFDTTRVRKVMQAIGFSGLAMVLAVVGYVDSVPLAIALMSLGNIFGGTMSRWLWGQSPGHRTPGGGDHHGAVQHGRDRAGNCRSLCQRNDS